MYHDTSEVKSNLEIFFTIEVHDDIYCQVHLPLAICQILYQIENLFNRDWTMCSKFVNDSRLNDQHNLHLHDREREETLTRSFNKKETLYFDSE